MDADEPVLWEVVDGIATITLNRPEAHNAVTFGMERRLIDLLAMADDDAEVRVVILTGAGRSFCVGGTPRWPMTWWPPRRGCVAERGLSWLLPRVVGRGRGGTFTI